jgi:hypothetical protein
MLQRIEYCRITLKFDTPILFKGDLISLGKKEMREQDTKRRYRAITSPRGYSAPTDRSSQAQYTLGPLSVRLVPPLALHALSEHNLLLTIQAASIYHLAFPAFRCIYHQTPWVALHI